MSLLPNVLAKQAAREQGAREAWFVDRDGRVTEGSSSNAWIVTRDGKVVTRQADHAILKGITRTVVLEAIAAQGLKLEERAFTLDEAHAAREAFITSASQIVLPVVKIDGRPVGNGAPGLVASALRRDFHRYAEIIVIAQRVSCNSDCPKSTRFCANAPPTWACARNGVPSNIHAPSPMADHHMARRLVNNGLAVGSASNK